MSRTFEEFSKDPCVNVGVTAVVSTPLPICDVPNLWLRISPNDALLDLKPVVFMLATLSPITERATPFAFMPLTALKSDVNIFLPPCFAG